ncbi:MAG: metalloregulator ArsR/SmtB family transcription factor [Sporichthyaceae bacterium]|nr:metalloregulator ArsR/SmtB family transcription factor [Sporichthyaceae bacterium]
MTSRATGPAGQAGRRALRDRDLMDPPNATRLEGIFKVLANDTRLRLLHALARTKELTVTDLCESVDMRCSAVSNQLQRLADKQIVASRRDGNHIWYRIADPCVPGLIDLAWYLMETPPPKGLG